MALDQFQEIERMIWEDEKKYLMKHISLSLIRNKALKIGDYVLSSGKRSPYYVDLRQAISNPIAMDWIGNSLARLHRACGWNVVGINHLGDWGTTFGMLLVAWEAWAVPGGATRAPGSERDAAFRASQEGALAARDRAGLDVAPDDLADRRFAGPAGAVPADGLAGRRGRTGAL